MANEAPVPFQLAVNHGGNWVHRHVEGRNSLKYEPGQGGAIVHADDCHSGMSFDDLSAACRRSMGLPDDDVRPIRIEYVREAGPPNRLVNVTLNQHGMDLFFEKVLAAAGERFNVYVFLN
ncbi:hypothetical protein SSX86_021443 [Deinandra increscens subsp. villosa]|uniref:Uncharacterized protein n=1 Tax=Deinandra increscens subsp. villosa TaxID=3103831 RepID=A0AAP0CV38_9ASTR